MLFLRNTNFSGVLNHFWVKHRTAYYSYVNVTSSGYTSTYYPENAIDFSSKSWWHQKANDSYIQFCLPQHKIRLTGYDIQTSTGSCRMDNWTITGCTNYFSCPSNTDNSQTTEQELGSNETAYVEWSLQELYQCFRIMNYGIICSNYGFDVKQVDFYGYLYSLINKNINSNVLFNFNCVSSYLFIFIIK